VITRRRTSVAEFVARAGARRARRLLLATPFALALLASPAPAAGGPTVDLSHSPVVARVSPRYVSFAVDTDRSSAGCSGTSPVPADPLAPSCLDGILRSYSSLQALERADAPGRPIWYGEGGSASCGGQQGYSNRWEATFWYLNALGLLARHGLEASGLLVRGRRQAGNVGRAAADVIRGSRPATCRVPADLRARPRRAVQSSSSLWRRVFTCSGK
jgi:hypothetical protein